MGVNPNQNFKHGGMSAFPSHYVAVQFPFLDDILAFMSSSFITGKLEDFL